MWTSLFQTFDTLKTCLTLFVDTVSTWNILFVDTVSTRNILFVDTVCLFAHGLTESVAALTYECEHDFSVVLTAGNGMTGLDSRCLCLPVEQPGYPQPPNTRTMRPLMAEKF
jgi:hypothetical protein